MITASQVQKAIDGIEYEFVDQCKKLHNKINPYGSYYFCGQHLRSDSEQRGLHGLAAAINVLAKSEHGDAGSIREGLLNYATDPTAAEQTFKNQENSRIRENDIAVSTSNTIKTSELIIALNYMPRIQGVGTVITKLTTDLLSGASDEGWGFFLSSPGNYQCLPTAHAVLALCKIGESEKAKPYLRKLYQDVNDKKNTEIDDSIRVFVLYVLVIANKNINKSGLDVKDLKRLFKEVWGRNESLLEIDIEQNIEYERLGGHHYVRIPWQLYLITTALYLHPNYLGKVKVQELIKRVVTAIDSRGGVVYPHSGNKLSSRTNSVVYSMLKKVKSCLDNNSLFYKPFFFIDWIRTFVSSNILFNIIRFFALCFIVYFLILMYDSDKKLNDLVPNLIFFLLSFVLAVQKRR